ncbi:glycoside hydrolase family 30 protein [Roseivirga sp.]|uniref:glycoside hydrolase family 30 protein n=1 Tax=Roseivirga sp. TaxID=1964215 RepID=UPI003B51921E
MKIRFVVCVIAIVIWACDSTQNNFEVMVTSFDQTQLLKVQPLPEPLADTTPVTIVIDSKQTFQEMDGFGYTLTGGSAMHLRGMSKEARRNLLEDLFSEDHGIGVSYIRLSVAASDLDPDPYSYAEIPEGEVDSELNSFSIERDREYLIPVLKEILAINPDLRLMASPWSPPRWMKDNGDSRGGSLLPEFYATYAAYLVKYITAMKSEGIHIDAMTVQNEPLHPGNNPSLLMLPEQQAEFVGQHLGPAFEANGIDAKIIIYDHNADRPDYPITVLNDPEARKYIHGSAFHLYGGEVEAISQVHEAHPDKHLYFTEQWVGAPGNFAGDFNWHVRELIIGASRNWCKTVLEWNLSSNPSLEPHTDRGGCDRCLGAVTIDGDQVTRNPAYYIIAQASKYVRPGSVRIYSNLSEGLANVAFKTPEGGVVLIALNESDTDKSLKIELDGKTIETSLTAGSVGTFMLN